MRGVKRRMTQLQFGQEYCCNCKHYKPEYRSGYIVNGYTGEVIGDGKGDKDGCTLHNTIVLKHSQACKDYEKREK